MQRPTEDRFLMTRDELENKMAVLLGGRAAEEVIFDHLSTGAANDLAKVTDIARSMVMRYGMVKTLGHVAYEDERRRLPRRQHARRHREFSEETAREIDVAVRDIVKASYDKALGILQREKRAARALGAEAAGEGDPGRSRARRAQSLARRQGIKAAAAA